MCKVEHIAPLNETQAIVNFLTWQRFQLTDINLNCHGWGAGRGYLKTALQTAQY